MEAEPYSGMALQGLHHGQIGLAKDLIKYRGEIANRLVIMYG
jgi:hypothetical protein